MNNILGRFKPGPTNIVGLDIDGKPISMDRNGILYRINGEVYTDLLYRFDGTRYVPIEPVVSDDDDEPVAESVQEPISPRSDNSDELFYSTQQLPSASPHPRPASPDPRPPSLSPRPSAPAPEPEIEGPLHFFQGKWNWYTDINPGKLMKIDNLNIIGNEISGRLTIYPEAFKSFSMARVAKQTAERLSRWMQPTSVMEAGTIAEEAVKQLHRIHENIDNPLYFLKYIEHPKFTESNSFYDLTDAVIYEFNDTLGDPEHTFPGNSLTGEEGNNPNHFKSTLVNLSEEFSVLTSGQPISIIFRDHDKYTGVDGKGNAKLRQPGSKGPYNEYLEIFLGNTNWLIREDSTTVGKELLTGAGKRYRKNKSKKRTKKLSKRKIKKLSKKRTKKLSKKRNKKTRKR